MKLSNSLFLAAFTLVAAGCSSTSDSGTDGGTDGGGDTIVIPTDTGSGGTDTGRTETANDSQPDTAGCQPCVASNCASETAACTADPTCAAGIACLEGCAPSDSACKNDCVNKAHGDATSGPIDPFVQCVQDHCAAECGF